MHKKTRTSEFHVLPGWQEQNLFTSNDMSVGSDDKVHVNENNYWQFTMAILNYYIKEPSKNGHPMAFHFLQKWDLLEKSFGGKTVW